MPIIIIPAGLIAIIVIGVAAGVMAAAIPILILIAVCGFAGLMWNLISKNSGKFGQFYAYKRAIRETARLGTDKLTTESLAHVFWSILNKKDFCKYFENVRLEGVYEGGLFDENDASYYLPVNKDISASSCRVRISSWWAVVKYIPPDLNNFFLNNPVYINIDRCNCISFTMEFVSIEENGCKISPSKQAGIPKTDISTFDPEAAANALISYIKTWKNYADQLAEPAIRAEDKRKVDATEKVNRLNSARLSQQEALSSFLKR